MNPYGPRPDHLNPDASQSSSSHRRTASHAEPDDDNRGRLVIRIVVSVALVLLSLLGMVITNSGLQVALGAAVILVSVTYALGRQRSTIGLLVIAGLTAAINLYELNWLAAAIWGLLLVGVWYARPQTA